MSDSFEDAIFWSEMKELNKDEWAAHDAFLNELEKGSEEQVEESEDDSDDILF